MIQERHKILRKDLKVEKSSVLINSVSGMAVPAYLERYDRTQEK